MKELTIILICLFLSVSLQARVITVDDDGPADFNNIQAAINDANDDDTVVVADGIYTGNGNRDMDFLGKAITVCSENGPNNCIIDCNGSADDPHRGFYFHSGEGPNSVLSGLTITNGFSIECLAFGGGGAIFCDYNYDSPTIYSSPTIANCIIKDNTSQVDDWCCYDCTVLADAGGGGIYCYESSAKIINCIFYGNVATRPGYNDGFGGGFCSYNFYNENAPQIINCTFVDNYAGYYCGAIGSMTFSSLVTNCIIWGNHPTTWGSSYDDPGVGAWAFGAHGSGGPTDCRVDFSVVQSNLSIQGQGNIIADPCFTDPCNGDYHLKSQAGRWDPNSKSWVIDDVTSPAIDAGNPTDPVGYEPFPNGGIVNMGAYGGTVEASKSYFGTTPCETIVAGDINGDCKVDYVDIALLGKHWLKDNKP